MTSQILVSSVPADDKENFSIRMRFKIGLSPERGAPPMGTNLIVITEALLTPKITVDFSMVVSSNCPTQYDAVNFIKCPQLVDYGGVYDYSVNFFISRPIGDYTFTFSIDQYSASIGHISLTLPPTFATSPEGYKINTEEFVTMNTVLTIFGYASVTNLLNLGMVNDSTLSLTNEISYYIPIFTANYKNVPVNFTYNVTIGSYSNFGSFMFITTTPAIGNQTLTIEFKSGTNSDC
uniref:GOLD domain-containing protein n=1 Tax=Schistosoma mansoni TaxID=6183 RepID=A0A5K4FBT8_SCHMA